MAIVRIDPEFESLIARPLPEEMALLEDSIRKEGCRDPLRVWGELLIDGHNRYHICKKWNIPFGTTPIDLPDRDAALLWMEENQLSRRNVTDSQRAMLIKSIEKRRANTPEAKAAQTAAATAARKSGTVGSKTLSTERSYANVELAEKHKIPQRKLQDAGTVLAAAAKPNAPQTIKDLPDRVKRGEMDVAEARKIVKAADPEDSKPFVRHSNPHNELLGRLRELDTPRFLSTIKALPPTDSQKEHLIEALNAALNVIQAIRGELYHNRTFLFYPEDPHWGASV